ncbi:MAG: hypothetical protein A2202_04445 [Bdellovibrionales bacterium RIFOXYA1_FULL_36_14]|nr:MAG: hypothetical protein A2202_04445 [Bdellovibrionales bacterium RIFOXYA1_FULL_36_14]
MNSKTHIIQEIKGLYKIIPMNFLRRTPGVFFDNLNADAFPRIDSIDRVIHLGGAISPGPIGDVHRPWYMHPNQDDNLIVLHGTRYVDIYKPDHGKIEQFVVTPNQIMKNNEIIFDGPAMLVWPRQVFHRIESSKETGSASINFATHYAGYDLNDNFNIYDVNIETGEYRVIREGFKDQEPGDM